MFIKEYDMLTFLIVVVCGFIGLIVVLALVLLGAYNGLVALREQVKSAFSSIDVALRQRFDMIPQLVDAAKGAMKFEKDTFKEVVEARNAAKAALDQISQNGGVATEELLANLQAKTKALDSAFAGMKVTLEAYPDLKSVETVKQLQDGIQSVENKIAFSRNHYNQTVSDYQTKRSQFPTVIVPTILPAQFPTFAYYQDSEKEAIQTRPQINF